MGGIVAAWKLRPLKDVRGIERRGLMLVESICDWQSVEGGEEHASARLPSLPETTYDFCVAPSEVRRMRVPSDTPALGGVGQ